jgi:hypothetical protein
MGGNLEGWVGATLGVLPGCWYLRLMGRVLAVNDILYGEIGIRLTSRSDATTTFLSRLRSEVEY